MTGVPHAIASKLVVGKLSSHVGFRSIFAAEYNAMSSFMFCVRGIPMTPCGIFFCSWLFSPTRTIWNDRLITFLAVWNRLIPYDTNWRQCPEWWVLSRLFYIFVVLARSLLWAWNLCINTIVYGNYCFVLLRTIVLTWSCNQVLTGIIVMLSKEVKAFLLSSKFW